MNESTKQFAWKGLIIAAILAGLFASVAYVSALFDGRVTFPKELETVILGALIAIIGFGINELRRRERKRDRQALLDELHSIDQNRADHTVRVVKNATAELKDEINNGGPKKAADMAATKTIKTLIPIILHGDQRGTDKPDTGERKRDDDGDPQDRR